MSKWEKTIASNYCDYVTDGTHDSPKETESGPFLITSKHLTKSGIDFSKAYHISLEDYKKIVKRSSVEEGDILFSMIGTIGNIALVAKHKEVFAVKNIGIFKCGKDQLKSRWLYYWLQSSMAKAYISNVIAGSTQGYITLGNLRNFPILFPSLEKATQIIDILSALDEKIETNRKINARLEELAQAIFKSWFIDNAVFEDQTIADYFLPKRGKNLLTSEAVLGDVPVVAGGLEPSAYHNESNTLAPVITISASGANAGYVNIWGQPVWSSDSSFIDNSITPYVYFWYSLLKFNQRVIFESQTGSAQPHIYPKHIGDLRIPVINEDSMAKFEATAKQLYSTFFNLQKESARLAELRDSLLPKLMSGELKPEECHE